MSNKPVAWMETYKGEPNNLDWDKNNLYCEGEFHNVVPLYTHPVKELTETSYETVFDGEKYTTKLVEPKVKELTDEEIRHIQAQCHLKDVGYDGFIMRFARAILRKASEK